MALCVCVFCVLCVCIRPVSSAVSIVWFKSTDLRLHDHEPLHRAHRQQGIQRVLPVLILDPRLHGAGRTPFGFVKMSHRRARFLLESVQALRDALKARGSNLLIVVGDPVVELPRLCVAVGAKHVLAYDEWAYDEQQMHRGTVVALLWWADVCGRAQPCSSTLFRGRERGIHVLLIMFFYVRACVHTATDAALSRVGASLTVMWGGTLVHLDDLPFSVAKLPDTFSQFRYNSPSSDL
jgi:deoxyribodipyrimidine photo-lyase